MKHNASGRRAMLSAGAATFALALAACGSSSGSGSGSAHSPIYIGAYMALSGVTAPEGQQLLRGYKFGVSQVNASGGIHGRKLVLVTKDDAGNPTTSASVAQELGNNSSIVAVLGTFGSGTAIPSSAVLEKARVPNIQPFTSAPQIVSRGFKYPFNTYPLSTYIDQLSIIKCLQMSCIAKPKTVSLVYDDDPFSIASAQQFEAYAKSHGISVVTSHKIEDGQSSYLSTATVLKSKKADLVWLATYDDETALLLPEMSQLSYVPKYVYTDGSELIDPPVVSAAGKLTVGGLSGLGWYPGSPVAKSGPFMNAYKAKEHTTATVEAAGGYQAVEILSQALQSLPASNINRETVRSALASHTFSTIYGQVKFGANGQGTSQVFLLQVLPGLKQQVILPNSGTLPKTITYLGN